MRRRHDNQNFLNEDGGVKIPGKKNMLSGKLKNIKSLAVIFSAACILTPSNAFAYIDPNAGGYIFQALFPILTAVAAGYLFFKNGIKKAFAGVVGFFKKVVKKQSRQ